MPYMTEGKCVFKKNPDGSKGKSMGCSDSEEMAKKHMAALYAAENKSYAEFSMNITKATVPDDGKRDRKMRLKMVTSDTGEDAYEERMSTELFDDFVYRIENDLPIPEPFDDVVCEDGWCGGMPYPSISHYKSGAGANVPGKVEKVKVDGERLKADVTLYENPLGLSVWKSVCDDLECRTKEIPLEERKFKNPVRVSIGFLDLEHKHELDDGDFVFTRTSLQERCPKCDEGINHKVYTKGQLVHLAFTRVPANPRTSVEVFRMADEEITTKKADAESIVGELADELVGKSTVTDDILVVKAEEESRDQKKKAKKEKEEMEEEKSQATPEKAEVDMEEVQEIQVETPAPVVETPAPVAKSKLELAVEGVLQTVGAVKQKAATKDQLQVALNELAKTINEETADPTENLIEQMRSMFREELDARIEALKPQLVAETLKSIPAQAPVNAQAAVPQARSLLINKSAPAQTQQLTEIQKIALRSMSVNV